MKKAVALVVAAGRGTRLGGDVPKQYQDLAGRPLLRHALSVFATHPGISAVRTVINPDDAALYEQAASGLSLLAPVAGASTRQGSVLAGLESIAELNPELVLIHDGARPFIDTDLISRVLRALDAASAALPAIIVADTLKRAEGARVLGTVSRDGLYRAQTPQGFRYADILAAHRAAAGRELTDDSAVAEAYGMEVRLVDGAEANVKITQAGDLDRARQLLLSADRSAEIRTGNGFDVHRFGPGQGVWLCGVLVPHDAGLEGHSDADVALHALVDAILGAIGGGDIGHHFPPGDPRWKGASSDRFLRHAGNLVQALGGRIVHLDVTIICERPKVGPFRGAMRQRIAEILGISEGRVSVKATTTEGLGFTGRREGIAAQATASVRLPVPD